MVVVIEKFFGVYLLVSVNQKHRGETYIGFTVDPERRIKQHNNGRLKGGARKTDKKRPWEMVLIVHGFLSDIDALKFEWAWQQPKNSTRIRHVEGKRRAETRFEYRVRLVCEMLDTNPWKRMCLTFRWLKQDFAINLNKELPSHMKLVYGPVSSRITTDDKENLNESTHPCDTDSSDEECPDLMSRVLASRKSLETVKKTCQKCFLCSRTSDEMFFSCTNTSCNMTSHATCLAQNFLADDNFHLVPIQGNCPICSTELLWGELVRNSQGLCQFFK